MNNVNITLYDHIAFEYINKHLSIDNLIYKTGLKLFYFDMDIYYSNLNNILSVYYNKKNLINNATIKKLKEINVRYYRYINKIVNNENVKKVLLNLHIKKFLEIM